MAMPMVMAMAVLKKLARSGMATAPYIQEFFKNSY
jgi:hypothetical protein